VAHTLAYEILAIARTLRMQLFKLLALERWSKMIVFCALACGI
jgi:hypothetical protein